MHEPPNEDERSLLGGAIARVVGFFEHVLAIIAAYWSMGAIAAGVLAIAAYWPTIRSWIALLSLTELAAMAISLFLLVVVAIQHFGLLLPKGISEWMWQIKRLRPTFLMGRRVVFSGSISRAFASTYAIEEAGHIRGRRFRTIREEIGHLLSRRKRSGSADPGPRVYTSFVSYSALVQKTLEMARKVAKKRTPGEQVTCLTTLNRPLVQWFNNKIDTSRESFPYVSIDDDWCDYIHYMWLIAHTRVADRVVLRRVVHAYCGENGENEQTLLTTKEAMGEACQSWILVPKGVDVGTKWLEPSSRAVLKNVIDSLPAGTLRAFIESTYGDSDLAYIIVPPSVGNPDVPGHNWMNVGDAFVRLFGPTFIHNAKTFVCEVNHERYKAWFGGRDGRPDDLFLIGAKKKGENSLDWRYGFAATADQDSQMVRVEFADLTKPRSLYRFEQLLEIVDAMEDGLMSEDGNTFLIPLHKWTSGLRPAPGGS